MWVVPGRTARPSRSASPTSARSNPTSAASRRSIARRVQRRRSVATWSLRERPVWSRPATGPTRSARADSRLRWTSSRAGSQVKRSAATSSASDSSPVTSSSTCSPVSSPARPSPRTCAIEPEMSSAASSRSTSIELVNASTRASLASLNRPPQSRIVPPCRRAGRRPSVSRHATGPGSAGCGPENRRNDHPGNVMVDTAPDPAVFRRFGSSATLGRRDGPVCDGSQARARPAIAFCWWPLGQVRRSGERDRRRRTGLNGPRVPASPGVGPVVADRRSTRSRASRTSTARPRRGAARRPPRRSGRAGSRRAARSRP